MTTGQHLIGGRYELGELLGRGGMAEVRKGTDTRLGRVVAIKRLRTDLASDATFQARFRREAQSAASLNHPVGRRGLRHRRGAVHRRHHVVQPYIVMEYVAGSTLRDLLASGRAARSCPSRPSRSSSGVLVRTRLRPPAGHRPPRHQAREHHAHAQRRREGHGLRHRPRRRRPRPRR